PHRWLEANKRYLEAAMGRVRCMLARRADDEAPELPDASVAEATAELERRAAELPSPSALDTLCAELRLSPFERDVLVLCAAVELDGQVAACLAAAQGSDILRATPTFGLALAALAEPHWSALTPAAPLRRWRLVELGPGPSLTASPLRIDERILHFLLGVSYLDERLDPLVTPI